MALGTVPTFGGLSTHRRPPRRAHAADTAGSPLMVVAVYALVSMYGNWRAASWILTIWYAAAAAAAAARLPSLTARTGCAARSSWCASRRRVRGRRPWAHHPQAFLLDAMGGNVSFSQTLGVVGYSLLPLILVGLVGWVPPAPAASRHLPSPAMPPAAPWRTRSRRRGAWALCSSCSPCFGWAATRTERTAARTLNLPQATQSAGSLLITEGIESRRVLVLYPIALLFGAPRPRLRPECPADPRRRTGYFMSLNSVA